MKPLTGIVAVIVIVVGAGVWRLESTGATTRESQTKVPDLGVGADLHGYRLFPADDAWNLDISKLPVDPNSDAIIKSIGANTPVHPDFGAGEGRSSGPGIPYVVVGKDQKKVPIRFTRYGEDSDPGPYPFPLDAPIEGGGGTRGDRHVLVLDRDAQILYEVWQGVPNATGWSASSGAVFDLTKPSTQRTEGWTSSDAAGLPVLPGLVRYDEIVGLKTLDHALRFTVRRSRRAYVPPARHQAGRSNDESLPPMGMRVRLKADFDISGFSPTVQVILNGLKTYGLICADNGSDWYVTGAPDSRWNDADLKTLGRVKGKDFEVIRIDGLVTPGGRAATRPTTSPAK